MAKFRARRIFSRLPRSLHAIFSTTSTSVSYSKTRFGGDGLEWTIPEPLKSEGQELTLRIEHEVDQGSGLVESQPQSSLMRLPRELRDQIWEECLGNLDFYPDFHCVFGKYQQRSASSPPHIFHFGLMSLPLTCRQVYGETINILYTKSRSHVVLLDYNFYLHYFLPQRRIQSIQNLSLFCRPSQPPSNNSVGHNDWIQLWKTVSLFTNLKILRVEIEPPIPCKYDWEVHEERLLEELKTVTQPEIFELHLHWPSYRQFPELPCRIKRTV